MTEVPFDSASSDGVKNIEEKTEQVLEFPDDVDWTVVEKYVYLCGGTYNTHTII